MLHRRALITLVALAASVALASATTGDDTAAQAHSERLLPTGSRRILADVTDTSIPRWGSDSSFSSCALDATWEDLSRRRAAGGALWKAGGLGGLMEAPRFQVWVCEEGHTCAEGDNPFFCFVYDEDNKVFVPWGPNAELKLVPIINECDVGPFTCDDNAACTNTPGSFTCTCNTGYVEEFSLEEEEYYCWSINECENASDNTCDTNAKCTNTDGSFTCACNAGYFATGPGDGTECRMP